MSDTFATFLCGSIAGFILGWFFMLFSLSFAKKPPYAGKTGNEYLPDGVKPNGPIEKDD